MNKKEETKPSMNTDQLSGSLSAIRDMETVDGSKLPNRVTLADKGASPLGSCEFIDSRELASRWDIPVSWVRDQVRSRAEDPLPHVHFGKYVRFLWGSPDLEDWIARRIVKGNNRRVGRVQ